jgi:hypothetical protein
MPVVSLPFRPEAIADATAFHPGSAMAALDYRQATEIRDAFARRHVRYLFIGKSGAILLGYPDTTQDAHLFVAKSPENGRALVAPLREIGFPLTDTQSAEIERGRTSSSFDMVRSTWIWCSLLMASSASRTPGNDASTSKDSRFAIPTTSSTARRPPIATKDRESLPRLRAFREYWMARRLS